MVTTQLGVNAPNGNVGVHAWLRNAESAKYTAGIIRGFTPTLSSMTVAPAGGSPLNFAQCNDPLGNVVIVGCNTSDSTHVELTAPTTYGQSICYAIVLSVDSTETTTINDGVGTVKLTAVAGSAAAIGSELVPSDSVIRGAIANGSAAYVCVLMTITVDYGQNALRMSDVNRTLQGNVPINNQLESLRDPYISNTVASTLRPYWTGNGMRSDGQMIINQGNTELKFVKTGGNLSVVLGQPNSGVNSSGISGIVGDYLVSISMNVNVTTVYTWANVGANPYGDCTIIGQPQANMAINPPIAESATLALQVPCRFPNKASAVYFQLHANRQLQLENCVVGVMAF